MGVDLATCALVQLLRGCCENFLPPPADVDFRAEFQKTLRHSFA